VAGIDLSSLPGADEKEISESMFTVNLGPEFDNSDGVMDENDLKEVERRKQLVMSALVGALKTTFGGLQDTLRQHRESLGAMKEKVSKKRRHTSPTPGGHGEAQVAAAAGDGTGAPAEAGAAAAAAAPGAAVVAEATSLGSGAGAAAKPDDAEATRLEAVKTRLAAEADALLNTARASAAGGSSL
jgi:hypothetical protein